MDKYKETFFKFCPLYYGTLPSNFGFDASFD